MAAMAPSIVGCPDSNQMMAVVLAGENLLCLPSAVAQLAGLVVV